MKKFSILIIFIICILLVLPINNIVKGSVTQEDIAKKIIRFHVVANSDSDKDQQLKLKIRDEILKFIEPKLKKSNSLDESRNILKSNNNEMKKIAEDIIKNSNFKYSVRTSLSNDNFPVKEYGNIVLPAGEYEAYKIIIGNGKGENWWCVMFPPLCFIDITKGEVSTKETSDEMRRVLTEDEYSIVDNTEESTVILKSKVLEIFNSIFKVSKNEEG